MKYANFQNHKWITEKRRVDTSLLSFFKRVTSITGRKLFKRLKAQSVKKHEYNAFMGVLKEKVGSRFDIGEMQSLLKRKWNGCEKEEKKLFDDVAKEINEMRSSKSDGDLRINEYVALLLSFTHSADSVPCKESHSSFGCTSRTFSRVDRLRRSTGWKRSFPYICRLAG